MEPCLHYMPAACGKIQYFRELLDGEMPPERSQREGGWKGRLVKRKLCDPAGLGFI